MTDGVLGIAFGVCAAVSWAIGSTIIATLSGRAPAGALNMYKFALGACAILALDVGAHGTIVFHQTQSAWCLIGLSAVIGLGIGDNVYYGAITELGVGRAMVLLATAPIFAMIFGAITLNEHVTATSAIGAGTTLAGVGLVVVAKPHGRAAISQRGLALGIGAAVCQAIGSLLSRSAMNAGLSAFTSTWMRLVVALFAALAFGLATGSVRGWMRSLNGPVLSRMSMSTVVGTIIGVTAAQGAIKWCASTGIASTLLATSPVFVMPLAHRYAGERLTLRGVLGAVLAAVGVFVLATSHD